MDKMYAVRYRHRVWEKEEYEQRVFHDYAEARKAYDEIASHDYYVDVGLWNCVRVIGRTNHD